MALHMIDHRYGSKAVVRYVLLPLLIVAFAVGLSVPFQEWLSPMEAEAAMFPPPHTVPIDGDRAFGYLKQIVEIGPHTAGSPANAQVRKLVADHFKKQGAEIREQPFRVIHPQTGENLTMANLVGSWQPDNLRRVVIGAHYDTRPHPDQERLPARQNLPFVGANDPASGIALLMEISNHLANLPTQWGVDLVLFDAEELVFGNNAPHEDYFLGSKEFARIYSDRVRGNRTQMRYENGIVLDLIGGRNLRIKREPKSAEAAPRLMSQLWGVAQSLRITSFRREMGREVSDDHLPLIDAGIPTVDLIDFDYPFWHTADDLPENCSGESMADVGRVVTTWLTLSPPKAASRTQQARRRKP